MRNASVPLDGPRPASDVVGLVTRPSGWGRVRLYGAASTAGHIRRRADTITLALLVLALAMLVPTARTTDGMEAALAEVVASLPTLVEPVAALAYDLLAIWSVVMVLLAVLRRRWRLALALLTAVPIAVAVSLS